MTCLKALREAARVEVNVEKRAHLIGAASILQENINLFCLGHHTAEDLTNLNEAWAYASRVLKVATPPVSTPPTNRLNQLDPENDIPNRTIRKTT